MLDVGCFASLCRDRLADHLVAFARDHPHVAVGMHEMTLRELDAGVRAGALSLAIGPGLADGRLSCRDLWEERAVVALPPGHALAHHPALAAAALRDEVLLVSRDPARAALHRFLVARLFEGAPPRTRVTPDARRLRTIDRVAAGEGIMLLCASQVDASLDRLAIRPLGDASAGFAIRACWRGTPGEPLASLIRGLGG